MPREPHDDQHPTPQMSGADIETTNLSGMPIMNKTLIGTALVAAFTLFALPAHANCSDPRAPSPQSLIPLQHYGPFAPHEGIVGTWLVTYPGNGQAFIQWHSDGTEWENITHPTISGNVCMGSWIAIGPWTYYRNHFGWLFDSNGNNNGYFNETETDTLSKDGNSYAGTNVTTLYNLDHSVMAGPFPGTSTATRIDP
jgi:hypothetical protein